MYKPVTGEGPSSVGSYVKGVSYGASDFLYHSLGYNGPNFRKSLIGANPILFNVLFNKTHLWIQY